MKKLVENIFELNRFYKILIQLMVDGFLIMVSFLLAWYLRLDQNYYILFNDIWIFIYILLPSTLLIFYKLAFYQNIIRFISISFLKVAFLGSACSAVLIYLTAFLYELYLPRSIPLIYLFILLTFTCIPAYFSLFLDQVSRRLFLVASAVSYVLCEEFLFHGLLFLKYHTYNFQFF